MNSPLLNDIPVYILASLVFILILLFHWLVQRLKFFLSRKVPDLHEKGSGLTIASILGVLSILMGFTFSITLSKFENRRELIVQEANDIGTAILRCDLFPDSIRDPLMADFKQYIESRIAYYDAGENEEKIQEELKKAAVISGRIWKRVAVASQDSRFIVRSNQMIPILNDMIDIVTTREAARISMVPRLILWTLLLLVLASAGLMGSDNASRIKNRILLAGYAIVMTLTLNLILELDRPRQGMINNDQVEQKIEALREMLP